MRMDAPYFPRHTPHNLYEILMPLPPCLYASFTPADIHSERGKDAAEGVREGKTDMTHVLLVEDEEPLRRILARNLSRRGYDVTEAESVTAATALLRSDTPFDVLLLDVNLPDRTGWDVLRALEGSSMPPVIVMTALRPAQSRLAAFRPAAMLLKPFPIDALLRLVERVLGQAGAESAP